MSEWQPIETAPKDGTSVLVGGGTLIDQSETYPQPLPLSTPETAYFAYLDGWIIGNSETYWEYLIAFPTHWQPLPPPPA